MAQGRCMQFRQSARKVYAWQSALLAKFPEKAGQEPYPVSYEGMLAMADCLPANRKAEPTQAERKRIATAKKPRQRTVYRPDQYAKSVPAAKPGTRSTVGVTIIHSGPNRASRRANDAADRRTTYQPRTNDIARLGSRSRSRAASREAQLAVMERQRFALAQDRKRRVAATRARNAEKGSTSWK